MRKCLICGSLDVVTPLLGMLALCLCRDHRLVASEAHRAARDRAEAEGQPSPILTEEFARDACRSAEEQS